MEILFISLVIVFGAVGLGLIAYRLFLASPARKPHEHTMLGEENYYLPPVYGEDELVALVKDPYWIYAYWEVTDQTRQHFNKVYGDGMWEISTPLLRVYDLTESGAAVTLDVPFTDLPINPFADNWYINVGQPNHTYCLDLGRLLPNGVFVTVLRSNTVTTPSDRVSDIIDPLWPPVEAIWRTFGRSVSGTPEIQPSGLSSPVLLHGISSEIVLKVKE
ncbi:MAG: DUF4912 domain-containing protein [Syntrophomonadaceae bacterium]|nr:DUF4912 domain-containing protein [Syntrophomonadaceae bacterium]